MSVHVDTACAEAGNSISATAMNGVGAMRVCVCVCMCVCECVCACVCVCVCVEQEISTTAISLDHLCECGDEFV